MPATLTQTSDLTGTWDIDQAHSTVGFAVKHMGVSTVRGEFSEFEGTIEIGDDLTSSQISGAVDAGSVNTNNSQRDEHLRSADFFDAESNPKLSFESSRIEQLDEDNLKVVGDLTLNGTTREIEIDAELVGVGTGAQDEERIGIEATAELSRKDYGMKFNAALGSGNAVVADKVKLVLDVAAVKRS